MRITLQVERRAVRVSQPHARKVLSTVSGFLFLLLFLNPSLCRASPGNIGRGAARVLRSSQSNAPGATQASFDGERALEHVRKMVEMGPRPAGSAELARTREYILAELKSYGLKIKTDEFEQKTPVGKRRMVNLTAELPGAASDFIIIASHYDTKLFEGFRFVGANDGGSSTGALLELARVLAASPHGNHFTYRFVFFDGEEAFCRGWKECGTSDNPDNTYGSRRYVARLREKKELKRLRALLLLDMVGYQRLQLGRDVKSTPWLLDTVWKTARELGHGAQFAARTEGVGGDDHEPFLQAGVASIDLIQLNTYPHWHKQEDTFDKISPRSLKIIGDVVLASLPKIEERMKSDDEKQSEAIKAER